jgi:AcrR family transcriptional regulator
MAEPTENDFRRRSAQKRREKMRAHLLDATQRACAELGSDKVSLQDILEAADVARGTFYAHFDSLHDAITIVARRLIDEAQASHAALYAGVTDPLLRISVGPLLFLTRAALQPAWANTIIESGDHLLRSPFVREMRHDVLQNMRCGNIPRTDPQAALDMHVGLMIQGTRTLRWRRYRRGAYIRAVDFNLLLALGVPRERAEQALDAAIADVNHRAPKGLDWWRPIT